MKKITITITHNLTPFHTESMTGMLNGCLEGLTRFWNDKSKKLFKIEIN